MRVPTPSPAASVVEAVTTIEVDAVDENGSTIRTSVPITREFAVLLDGRQLATLGAASSHPGLLAIGRLDQAGLLEGSAEIVSLDVDTATRVIRITTREPRIGAPYPAAHDPLAGDDGNRRPPRRVDPSARLAAEVLDEMLRQTAGLQPPPALAGVVHSCMLFSNAGATRGELVCLTADLSARLAIEAASGWLRLKRRAPADMVVHVGGPLDATTVSEVVRAGIPVLLSPDSATAEGIDAARQAGLTLIGHCRGRRHLIYTGAQRMLRLPVTGFA